MYTQMVTERKTEEALRKNIKLIQEGIEKNREEIRLLSQQIDDKVNANVTMGICINVLKAEADKIAKECQPRVMINENLSTYLEKKPSP